MGLVKGSFVVLCVMFASGPPAAADTATAKCRLSAGPSGAVIGSFTVTGRFKSGATGFDDRRWARKTLKRGLTKCYRAALNTRGYVARSCTERQNYPGQSGEWSEVRGWRWPGDHLKDAAVKAGCGGANATKEVLLWVSCEGQPTTAIWRGVRCPGRPALPPRPKLPPASSSQEESSQEELSLACLGGRVANGACVCPSGTRPQLIGPRAYRCTR